MSDGPVIPQGLARDLAALTRNHAEGVRMVATAKLLVGELDALEQPADPAEVAAEQIVRHVTHDYRGYMSIPIDPRVIIEINHQAYAEQEKAVRALSDRVADHRDCHGCDSPNARVRKLFDFDKDKP